MAMGNSKGIVKRLRIEVIDATKYPYGIWVQRLSKGIYDIRNYIVENKVLKDTRTE